MLNWIYRHVPLINSEASLLIAFFTLLIANVGFLGGIGVHYFGLDITEMAYISFWVFDFSVAGLFLTPWLRLPVLSNYSNHQRLQFMVEIWVWLYVLIALTYEIPWVFGYDEIAYAEDELWAFPWWSYIHGGDIRYLYTEKHVLFSEILACIVAAIAAVALRIWYKSDRSSTTAVYMLMLCAGLHMAPTLQYYSLEVAHHFPNVDIGNPHNFWAKFIFSNSPWLIMPFVVFTWGTKTLPRLYGVVKD